MAILGNTFKAATGQTGEASIHHELIIFTFLCHLEKKKTVVDEKHFLGESTNFPLLKQQIHAIFKPIK